MPSFVFYRVTKKRIATVGATKQPNSQHKFQQLDITATGLGSKPVELYIGGDPPSSSARLLHFMTSYAE